ncbi:hypothetical protein RQ479_06095 [Mesorhizobium sp. ISC25]|uniref:hypothetical protein n=1 Tax=Mesorhizobium sp. ISC25 TaxID=3077335 RepID=UPI0035D92860
MSFNSSSENMIGIRFSRGSTTNDSPFSTTSIQNRHKQHKMGLCRTHKERKLQIGTSSAGLLTEGFLVMTLAEALDRATVSVPDAGRLFFNLARNASYDAAKRGEIPTVKIGGKILVPVAPVAQQLGLRSTAGREAA